MRIVALDGFTLNPGDISWAPIQALGEFVTHDRTPSARVIERLRAAHVVLTNKVALDRTTIESLPDLHLIAVTATGYNIVDASAAKERGVVVCNVPEYGTPNVAQHVFALLLELTTHVGPHAQGVREGKWSASPDWCYWEFPLVELSGLTLGIIGYGRIGRAVANIARALGMNVLMNRRTKMIDEAEARQVDLDTLVRESDVISLHCPLTPDNEKMVNRNFISRMKRTSFLINTARGGLINEAELAQALNDGRIAGAGLDVLTCEPPDPGNPLIGAKNCVITPHIAWATRPARERMMQITAKNIRAFQQGQPQNVVNP